MIADKKLLPFLSHPGASQPPSPSHSKWKLTDPLDGGDVCGAPSWLNPMFMDLYIVVIYTTLRKIFFFLSKVVMPPRTSFL